MKAEKIGRVAPSTCAIEHMRNSSRTYHLPDEKSSGMVQPKLAATSQDQSLEHEDTIVNKLIRKKNPDATYFSSTTTLINRKCVHCEEEEEKKNLQRKGSNGASVSSVPSIVDDVLSSSSGKAMDESTRSFMESRFNYDFSSVKIHDNNIAAKSADSINALAYTSGNNIVFNSGQYNTISDSGKRLLAHELTHVVQQSRDTILRQQQPPVNSQQDYEEERRGFQQAQDRFYEREGEMMTAQILHSAGFAQEAQLTTSADAERLIGFWGLSMSTIVSQMTQIASSLTTRVVGQVTQSSLAQQQQGFVNALSSTGQQAYTQAIHLVRAEAYWDNYFNRNDIYIFPDLQGNNRFSGYNQAVPDPNDTTGTRKVIIVHISQDPLNNNFPEISSSTIVHELSHVIYDPAVLERSLRSLKNTVADLLVDHPTIAATRQGVADPAVAREEQRKRISQIVYETIAYGEEEIFVHLQQITHQPDISIRRPDGSVENLRGAQVLQHEVLRYVQRLQRIGLEQRMLNGILDQIYRRVNLMFDDRINALTPGRPRQIMQANKQMAQLLFEIARRGETL